MSPFTPQVDSTLFVTAPRIASTPPMWQECAHPESWSEAMRPVLVAHSDPDDFRDLLADRFPDVEFAYATTAQGIADALARHDPEVALLHQAPRVPGLRARADPGPPLGALDPDRRLGVRPPAPLGHRAGHRDQRRRRARPVPRRERHRGDARARLRVPALWRAAARAAVASGGVHAASGPHAAGGRLRPDRGVRRAQREGARHAGAGHPGDAGAAPGGGRDARTGRAPRAAFPARTSCRCTCGSIPRPAGCCRATRSRR